MIGPSRDNPELADLLAKAVRAFNAMSPDEVRRMLAAQRRSYVIGEAGMGSDQDEADYRCALESGDAKELARLESEARERELRAAAILDADDFVTPHRENG